MISIVPRSGQLSSITLILLSFGLASFGQEKSTVPKQTPQITFSHDIAPVVFRSCAPCHHSGEAGPFPLISYGDVKSHARQIADVTIRKVMPPWLPAQDGLRFEDDAHLSSEQIALFQKWVTDGTPCSQPYHYNLGIAQGTAENFSAAVQELTTAVKLKPDDAGAQANLGAAFAGLGETEQAILHFNRALEIDPGNALARENLDALRRGSSRP